jgi:hypothetical protein
MTHSPCWADARGATNDRAVNRAKPANLKLFVVIVSPPIYMVMGKDIGLVNGQG